MPEIFYDDTRRMRQHARREFLFILIAVASLILFVAAIVEKLRFLMICLPFIGGLSCLALYLSKRSFLRHKPTDTYFAIPAPPLSLEALTEALGCEKLTEDAYVLLVENKWLRLRLLLQYTAIFDREFLTKERSHLNKAINQKYHLKETGPLDEIGKRLRINLVVCEQDSPAVVQWVGQNRNHIIHRNEGIIHAAVALDSRVLYLPRIYDELTSNQLDKYCAAAEILTGVLQIIENQTN
jgi:hypothetical protein